MEEIVSTMESVKADQLTYLELDELAAHPVLARRLPHDLAWRYHALPLSEDNGRISVVMAEPEDPEARRAVLAALGPTACVVKGSVSAIDARLAEVWGGETGPCLTLSACAFPEPFRDKQWAYTQALCDLLGAHLWQVCTEEDLQALGEGGEHARCDLVIFADGSHPLLRHLLSRYSAPGQAGASSILVAQRPMWPLERVLLVICGGKEDDAVVDWAVRLAGPSAAAITALAVVPPMPAMYFGLQRMEHSVAALLASDTALGRKMHHVARRLAESNVDSTLCLRQGAPDQQICRKAVEGDYDLVIIATRPCRWWLRQLKGDLVCSLLSWVERPLLIVA
jgi:nucleotide-binding universal stress UspA family protein